MTSGSDLFARGKLAHRALAGALATVLSVSSASAWAAEPAKSPSQSQPANPAPAPDAQDPTQAARPTSPGRDADAITRTLARDLASQGARAFEADDWATALDRFHRAYALFPAPSVAIMEARCLVRLGRLLEALTRYDEIQRIVLSPDASKPFRQALVDAKTEAQQVSASVPRVRILARSATGGVGSVSVRIDGTTVPQAILGVDCPMDPGRHELEVSAPGYAPETRAIVLAAGQHLETSFLLKSADSDGAVGDSAQGDAAAGDLPAAGGASTSAQSASRGGASSMLGWTAVGIGATALGISAITGLAAANKKSSLDVACNPGCPPEYADDIASFRSNRNWSYATLSAGALSLAVGGYLLLLRTSTGSSAPSIAVSADSIVLGRTF